MADDAILKIGADTAEAQKQLAKLQDSANKSLSGIEKSFAFIGKAAVAAFAAVASKKVLDWFGESVTMAAESESALNSLNTALQTTGIYSEETSRQIQEFADQIQRTTAFEGDAVIAATGLLQQIARLDKDGLQKASESAINLASAFNIDLETAMRTVAKATRGNVTALQRMGIDIKAGKTDAESLGNTLDALARFQGVAAAKANTFAGSLTQLTNIYGDLREEIGSAITQSPVFIGLIKELSKVVLTMIDYIKLNKESIQKFVNDGILRAVEVIPDAVVAMGKLAEVFGVLVNGIGYAYGAWESFASVIIRFNPFILVVDVVSRVLSGFVGAFAFATEGILSLAEKIPGSIGRRASEARIMLDKLKDSTFDFASRGKLLNNEVANGFSAITGATAESLKGVGNLAQGGGKGLQAFGSALKDVKIGSVGVSKEIAKIGKVAEETSDKAVAATKEQLYKLDDLVKAEQEIRKEIDKRGKSAYELIQIELDASRERAALTYFELLSQNKLTTQAEQVIDAYTKAAEAKARFAKQDIGITGRAITDIFNISPTEINSAAISFVDGIFTRLKNISIGDVLTGLWDGISSAISGAFDLGAYLFDGIINGKFIDAIESFMSEFPKMLARTLERTPVILKQFIKAVPRITQAIIDALPKLGAAVSSALPKLVDAVFSSLPKLLEAIPGLFVPLIKKLPAVFETVFRKLPAIITEGLKSFGTIAAEFVKVVPDIIVAILDNLDEIILALVEGIADASGVIITALIDAFLIEGGLERIIKALILAMPRIAVALIQGMTRGFVSLGEALGGAGARALKVALGNGNWFKWPPIVEPNWISKLQIKTPGWITTFTDAVNRLTNWKPGSIGDIGGSGQGLVPDSIPVIGGLAAGGVIPRGFPSDSFISGLTSGEMVIPRNDVDRLSSFLDSAERTRGGSTRQTGSESNGPISVILKVGERELSKVLLDLNRSGYRTA